MLDLSTATIAEVAAAIQTQTVTSVQIVQQCIDKIERVNPRLNALVTKRYEAALKDAAEADERIKRGEKTGPLHGVPMTIKDSLDTYDLTTTWGTQGREDFRPGSDATCVARLREAGAILIGKTNTPEFTLSFKTDNHLFGETKNPFDLSRTPGGSSGGAAALIAAGASLFDIGTDTGGSIRLPSHFCGIAGIKPTTGRVPCTGNALPSAGLIAKLSQPGPMAKSVADLELLLPIISGPDQMDPYCVDAKYYDSQDVVISDLNIAYHTDNGIKTPDLEIIKAIEQVANAMKGEMIAVTEARPAGIEMAQFILGNVFSADGGELTESLLEDSRTEIVSSKLQQTLDQAPFVINQQEFAQVINLWDNFRSSMLSFFNEFDVLICPVNAHTAIGLDEQEDLSAYTYTSVYNLTGWPAAVVRAGTCDKGLPIGVQIIAKPFREDHCLSVAAWIETKMSETLPSFAKPEVYAG